MISSSSLEWILIDMTYIKDSNIQKNIIYMQNINFWRNIYKHFNSKEQNMLFPKFERMEMQNPIKLINI